MLVYIDETGIQTQMYRQLHVVNEENGSIFVSAASVMIELRWLRHNVKVLCLLRTPTAERWKLLYSKSGLKMNCWTVYQEGTSSSWTTRHFIKKRFYRTLRENTRRNWFFCRRIHRNTILLSTRGALWSERLLAVFIYMIPFHRLWMPFYKAISYICMFSIHLEP